MYVMAIYCYAEFNPLPSDKEIISYTHLRF